MNTIQSITVVEDVTLISLQDSPADIKIGRASCRERV